MLFKLLYIYIFFQQIIWVTLFLFPLWSPHSPFLCFPWFKYFILVMVLIKILIFFFLAGVREEAMGWTMTRKDDLGVIARTWQAGNVLSLFLLLSFFSIPVHSDIILLKDHRFSWKAGTSLNFSMTYKCDDSWPQVQSQFFVQKNQLIWNFCSLLQMWTHAQQYPSKYTHPHTHKSDWLDYVLNRKITY